MVEYLSLSSAAVAVDPEKPLSVDALRAWHDRLSCPRDTAGRRIFTSEVIEQIKAARSKRQRASMRGRINLADEAAEAGLHSQSLSDVAKKTLGEDDE